MLIYNILLGLLGLGIVVFVHELGHFVGARLMGIGVEAFSVGWGKPIIKKKIGEVEYRLGMFPLGGYCKMKGQSDHEPDANQQGADAEKGSFYAAHPFRRIVVCFAGPLFNLFFAVLVLSVIWGIGFEVNTVGNRIVLVSEVIPGTRHAADEAGLKTGDRILEIRGRQTESFLDIQEIIALNAGENLPVTIERDGQILHLSVTPVMDRSTGAGRIGVHFWTDPVIERVTEGSPAAMAGLKTGDRILRINETDLPHTISLLNILDERPSVLNIEFLRDNQIHTTALFPVYEEAAVRSLGIIWEAVRIKNPRLSPPRALIRGAQETWKTFTVSVRSLSILFRGVDLTQAVSGPIRITYMIGGVATEGFSQSFGAGISSMASFLSLISIALAIMNLLPLPVLDGGMIILYSFEALRGKPPHPKFITVFQSIGIVIIAGLMFFAIFGDILYLANR